MVNAAVLFKIIELHFFILMSYKIASSNCQYFYPPPPSQYDYYDPYYEPYQEAAHPTQSYHYGLPRSPYSDANRREENVAGGWNFQPQEVMSEAQKAAIMTRGMADLIDTKGNDFLSLLGDYTSTGIKYCFCKIRIFIGTYYKRKFSSVCRIKTRSTRYLKVCEKSCRLYGIQCCNGCEVFSRV